MQNSKKSTPIRRGHGKVEFNQNIDFIQSELAVGKNIAQIYSQLQSQNKITIDISVFRRYVRQLKERQAEASQSVVNPVADPAVSKPIAVTGSAAVVPVQAALNQTSTKQSGVFVPRPADLEDEFADDSSASKQSEVDHG